MLQHSLRRAGALVVRSHLATVCMLWGVSATASAAIVHSYEVGSGASTSTVQLDFSNGNGYLFTLHYDDALTGWSALQLMQSQLPGFTLQADVYPFGAFVTGMGIGADYEYGVGDQWPVVENYWHYWTRVTSGAWEGAGFGPSDRVLANGSADAWVFGSSVAPQEVPAAPAAALLACAGLLHRRRRR